MNQIFKYRATCDVYADGRQFYCGETVVPFILGMDPDTVDHLVACKHFIILGRAY